MSKDNKRPLNKGTVRWWAKQWREAAKSLKVYGWARGDYRKADGSMCLIGATASGFAGWYDSERASEAHIMALSKALYSQVRVFPCRVNDELIRNKEEAIRFARGVAYMFDHGGRLPPWAERIRAAREAS